MAKLLKGNRAQIASTIGMPLALGAMFGVAEPIAVSLVKNKILKGSLGGNHDLDIGIKRYLEKLRSKMERKYKGSKSFVNEYETKQELGIDPITGSR